METDESAVERDLADALRRLNEAVVVPPIDPAREAALLAAFDANRAGGTSRRQYWYMAALGTAAVWLIAVGITPAVTGRHGPLPGGPARSEPAPLTPRGVQLEPPNDFVAVPGAAALPPLESGTLVRIDLPASALPTYGLTPPAGRTAMVTADVIVGQDGLARAVRIVN